MLKKLVNVLLLFVLVFAVVAPTASGQGITKEDRFNLIQAKAKAPLTTTPPMNYKQKIVKKSIDDNELNGNINVQNAQADVLILEHIKPWSEDSTSIALTDLGISHETKRMDEVGAINLSQYKLIIIANDQDQLFYNTYGQNKVLFDNYVSTGGTLLFGIADQGWNFGTLQATLPGNVETFMLYEGNNTIADNNHPIVTGELSDGIPLISSDLSALYASHRSIVENTLPAGSNVILRAASDNSPTLVEYSLGKGTVIASGLTWEIFYNKNWGYEFSNKAYDDLLLYAYGGGAPASEIVFFLPGLLGSELYTVDEHIGTTPGLEHPLMNHRVWAPTPNDGYFAKHMVDHLAMNADGSEIDKLIAGDPLLAYYGQMMQQIQAQGYVVVPFGYDWRLDNAVNAEKLSAMIETIRNQYGIDKVNIVAHSMGGLIAAKYLSNGNADKVNKMVTIGTPYLGSPKTAYVFGTGRILGGLAGEVISENIAGVINNMPSAYQNLPSPQWFDLLGESYLNVEWDHNWFTENTYKNLETYSATKNLLNEWLNGSMVNNAETFHNSLDLLNNVVAQDNTYFIIGNNKPTIGKVSVEMDETNVGWELDNIKDIDLVSGDGTVPLFSATIGNNTPADRTYYVAEEHDGLTNNQDVIMQVLNILKGDSNDLAGNIDRLPQETKMIKLKVESPVELHVLDAFGKHMGPNGYYVEEKIKNGSYYLLGENNHKKVAFLNNGTYQVVLKGTGTGTMDFTMQVVDENDAVQKTIRFNDVNITPTTIIKAQIVNETIVMLLADWNGDDVVDETIYPSLLLNQVQSDDETAPELDVIVDGTKGNNDWYVSDVTVDMVATDAETGVSKIEYIINEGGLTNLFNQKLSFNHDGIYEILGKAWDNNQNFNEKYIELKIDKTKPTIALSTMNRVYAYGEELSIEYVTNDNLSGVATVTAELDGKLFASGETIKLNKQGFIKLKITTVDNAGNINFVSRHILVTDKPYLFRR
ncbi:lipase family alpha/beta hydrolase [Lottiidibacillus patelloidae]|nr:alpha/beta fold hydrolase [Lottiidibacillus patelloidae]